MAGEPTALYHRSEDAKEQTRREGARAAADMHEEAVQPLKSEVSRMRQALVNLQGTYTQDVDQVPPPAPWHCTRPCIQWAQLCSVV